MMLKRGDDVIEYQYFKKIALDNGIPYQIDPKAIPEKGQTFTVGRNPLPGDNKNHPAKQYDGGYELTNF